MGIGFGAFTSPDKSVQQCIAIHFDDRCQLHRYLSDIGRGAVGYKTRVTERPMGSHLSDL